MFAVVLAHRRRVNALLWQHRARDAGQREQKQQHQRGPHRGQLAPEPAQPADRTEPRLLLASGGIGAGGGHGALGGGDLGGGALGDGLRGILRRVLRSHDRSARTFAISARSPLYWISPMTLAAILPPRSITSVLGIAVGGSVL